MDSWSSYEKRIDRNLNLILNLLDENEQPATFFIVGWIAEKYPALIRLIHQRGYHIGLHSYAHQLLHEMNRESFRTDAHKCMELLSDGCGQAITSYRAPGFSLDKSSSWLVEELNRLGIEYDASIGPAAHSHGGIAQKYPKSPFILKTEKGIIKEFPLGYSNILGRRFPFVGGGYLRFYPLWFIHKVMKRGDYNLLYLHPRDFDIDQPPLKGLNGVRRFKQLFGLQGAYAKVDALLRTNDFMDVRNAGEVTNWSAVPIFDIERE